MKKLFTVLAVAALAIVGIAASYNGKTLNNGAAFVNVGSTATNVGLIIDCVKQDSVGLSWKRHSSGATSGAIGIAYSRSHNRTDWDTTWEVMSLAGGGAANTVTTTNIPTHGFGYIKIHYATNANAGTVYTTNTIGWAEKIP
jgi:hypothetical protein